MLYLKPQVKSGLGEDTFWTWAERELRGSFDIPADINANDIILQYSTCGPSKVRGGIKVALLWELHPEMISRGIPGDWTEPMINISACEAASQYRVISSKTMQRFYLPGATLLPIGIDTDLFMPRNKVEVRKKHGLPVDKTIGFWCGWNHPMKGYDRFCDYKDRHKDYHWIEVHKGTVTQPVLAELMSAADFALFTGRLRPYYMVEWEAMATDLPVIDISGLATERDFEPMGRQGVFDQGWSRHQSKQTWLAYLETLK